MLGFLLVACAHESKSSREPSSITAYPTALLYDQANIELSNVTNSSGKKIDYNLVVDLFHLDAPGNSQPTRVILYFGPVPAAGIPYKEYFLPILRGSGINATFVTISDDYDGQLAQKLLTGPAGFDRFLNGLFAILKDKKWISDFNEKLILLAHHNGAETLDKIGSSPSNIFRANAEAVAFFDGQLAGSSAPGIVNLLSEPKIGFKTYVASTSAAESGAEAIRRFIASAEAESSVSVEHVSETIETKTSSPEVLLSGCLPLFLRALRQEPFITFRCSDAAK